MNAFARDAVAAVSRRERKERRDAPRDAEADGDLDDSSDDSEVPPPALGSLDVFDVESPVWTRFWSDDWNRTRGLETAACAELGIPRGRSVPNCCCCRVLLHVFDAAAAYNLFDVICVCLMFQDCCP